MLLRDSIRRSGVLLRLHLAAEYIRLVLALLSYVACRDRSYQLSHFHIDVKVLHTSVLGSRGCKYATRGRYTPYPSISLQLLSQDRRELHDA